MLYPTFVELGNEKQAYSVVMPDFPGCFSATDQQENLATSVQEAVELYFEGEQLTLPEPSKIADLINNKDYDYEGVWMMFDIDTTKISTKSKRINITFPEVLLTKLDHQAKQQHLSRSAYLQKLVTTSLY